MAQMQEMMKNMKGGGGMPEGMPNMDGSAFNPNSGTETVDEVVEDAEVSEVD